MKKQPAIYNQISQQTAIAGWAYYAFELLFLPGLLLGVAERLGIGPAGVNFAYYFLNFIFCVWIFKGYLSGSVAYASKHIGAFLWAVLLGCGACWATEYALGFALSFAAPEFYNINDQAVAAMLRQHPVLMAVGTVALVPVAEECLFRGLIFSQLKPGNRAMAYAVSALLFCAVHVMGYVGSYPAAVLGLCFLQYLPAGLILAWSYERCGSVLAPILIHTTVNILSVFRIL